MNCFPGMLNIMMVKRLLGQTDLVMFTADQTAVAVKLLLNVF
jgi:hypothetical protein